MPDTEKMDQPISRGQYREMRRWRSRQRFNRGETRGRRREWVERKPRGAQVGQPELLGA